MEEILDLIASEKRLPLTPEKRVRDFLETLQRIKNGECLRIRGFLILRKPPNAPRKGLYYLLSPIAPSEMKRYRGVRVYLVVKIDENTKIEARIHSGEYVEIEGILDVYPWGTLRLLHAKTIKPADYSDYWTDYRGFALSRKEIENLISNTVYASYELEQAILYSLFTSPIVLGTGWKDGFTLSGFRGSFEKNEVVLSLWGTLKYLHSLLPWEMKLRKDNWGTIKDDGLLGIDFKFSRPSRVAPLYYVPYTKSLLEREVPIPQWALKEFKLKKATFLTPRMRMKPDDETALLSEVPFVLTESVGYERNPELERLMPNLVITVILARRRIGILNLADLNHYRSRFESFMLKNREEYGELFDAMTISGKVFDANFRYRLGARLLGSMARVEGGISKSLVSGLIGLYQEITDLWINELPEREKLRLLREYERYIGNDKLAGRALRIFSDLEATSTDGTVSRDSFINALVKYGISEKKAVEIVDNLLREGYLYEPYPMKLRLIRW